MTSYFFGPIPGTSFISSICRKRPCVCRHSTMFFDRAGPTPGKICNSSAGAVLISIRNGMSTSEPGIRYGAMGSAVSGVLLEDVLLEDELASACALRLFGILRPFRMRGFVLTVQQFSHSRFPSRINQSRTTSVFWSRYSRPNMEFSPHEISKRWFDFAVRQNLLCWQKIAAYHRHCSFNHLHAALHHNITKRNMSTSIKYAKIAKKRRFSRYTVHT